MTTQGARVVAMAAVAALGLVHAREAGADVINKEVTRDWLSNEEGTATDPGNTVRRLGALSFTTVERGRSVIMAFEVPVLPAGETFDSAHLTVLMNDGSGSGVAPGQTNTGGNTANIYNVDLWGIGFGVDTTPFTAYLEAETDPSPSAVKIEDNYIDFNTAVVDGTAVGRNLFTSPAGAANLKSFLDSFYADPANAGYAGGSFAYLRLNPDADPGPVDSGYVIRSYRAATGKAMMQTIASAHWTGPSGGTWDTAGNWTTNAVPSGADKAVTFGTDVTGPITADVPAAQAVGLVRFDSPAKYTLTGAAPLTLEVSAGNGNAGIYVVDGSHEIAAPLVMNSSTTVYIPDAADAITLSGELTTATTGLMLTKVGLGTIESKNFRVGTLRVDEGAARVTASGGAATGASVVDSLNVGGAAGNWVAKVDITDNKLIVQTGSAGTATAGVYDGIQGLVQSGYAGGAWTGNGITSSSAAAIPAGQASTAIGVATGAQIKPALASDPSATALFAGQTITGSSVIAMYTYGGDANLDGLVSGDDYTAIDFAIAVPDASGWVNGDFNYDGIISGDDYTVIDFNVAAQGGAFPTGGAAGDVAAVPEPSAGGLAALAAASVLGWRRRRLR